ncbi:hypothetical protein KBTX_01434 [wastewater metagenome]|uniref:GGDEF domain-containing protein n=2 Tax=unclassified sequences TaxID=12908 RepID=A0A5B8RE84_9ZZZZ|nr:MULTISPECIES: GGDEF domain-containing protein [Arhodomonas]MCS4504869.1 GGDEF domain-containing protein [Arhodomonas aquaeolei]QEA05115.1 hypothetical protein KBTEX_01434 [uncultured organism]
MSPIRRLWLVEIALFLAAAVPVVGLTAVFFSNASRDSGADYTAFAAEVVRAQQEESRLGHAVTHFLDRPDATNRQALLDRIAIIRNRQETARHALAALSFGEAFIERMREPMTDLDQALERLEAVVRGDHPARGPLADVVRDRAYAVQDGIAYVYSQMLDRVLQGSAAQRRFMDRLEVGLLVLAGLVLAFIIGLIVAIRFLREQKRALTERTVTDYLTGLANRRAMVDRARDVLALAARSRLPCSLAIIDLDHFKLINDRYGHPVGDRVLRTLGARLPQLVRESDVVARLGGEEFCILMPDTRLDGARELCERLRAAVARLRYEAGETDPVGCTVSIGLACTEDGAESFASLYSRADRSLYAAKAAGRDRVLDERDVA